MVQDIGFNILVPLSVFSFIIFGAIFFGSVALDDLVRRRQEKSGQR